MHVQRGMLRGCLEGEFWNINSDRHNREQRTTNTTYYRTILSAHQRGVKHLVVLSLPWNHYTMITAAHDALNHRSEY